MFYFFCSYFYLSPFSSSYRPKSLFFNKLNHSAVNSANLPYFSIKQIQDSVLITRALFFFLTARSSSQYTHRRLQVPKYKSIMSHSIITKRTIPLQFSCHFLPCIFKHKLPCHFIFYIFFHSFLSNCPIQLCNWHSFYFII